MPMVRLSNKERLIVGYIVTQLERAYRNTAGKAVYARNMDQVMKDIFGMKKFCKTLAKATHNEAILIELMKALDTETLWKICRSKEHYRLFCSLIAMDHTIVKMGKKLNSYAEMAPTERPTRKVRKLMKELKRYKKMYPPGTRIELLSMGSDPRPIESGTRGSVAFVDDIGTLHCDFDNGRRLGVIPGEDSFRTLTEEELLAESAQSEDEPMQRM